MASTSATRKRGAKSVDAAWFAECLMQQYTSMHTDAQVHPDILAHMRLKLEHIVGELAENAEFNSLQLHENSTLTTKAMEKGLAKDCGLRGSQGSRVVGAAHDHQHHGEG